MRDCAVAVVLIHYIYRGSMVAMPVAMSGETRAMTFGDGNDGR
jgi:hypothetical protein